MKIFADLHIHSKYSRATSREMDLEHLSEGAKTKGLNVLGTGDFTHPLWLKELKSRLTFEDDVYEYNGVKFIPTAEISLMYNQDKKMRKIHHLILAPDFEVVDQINDWLKTKGRLDYDGRPIFGMTSPELVENIMSISKDIEIIPAHAWTPWFGIFGSMSGFDSVEECFLDQSKHIHALETGLSSDPAMNWRLSSLDKYTLISNSDSHSPWPWRIGREANVFDLKKITYKKILRSVRTKKNLLYTIEVDPAYGKYHIDGHRACKVSMEPKEAMKNKNICPVCGRPLTIGVLHRVEELADRPEGFVPKGAVPFKSLIPLSEIISSIYGLGLYTQTVKKRYYQFIEKFGTEFSVLLDVEKERLAKVDDAVADVIISIREGKAKVKPGYDGVYGKLILEKKRVSKKRKESQLNKFL